MSDLALPERALRRSILQSRTQVRSCRLSLAKLARLCDIAHHDAAWSCANRWAVAQQARFRQAAARGQSLGKSADICSVEDISPLLRRCLDFPATLPHDPSASSAAWSCANRRAAPGRREVVFVRMSTDVYGCVRMCTDEWLFC